MATFSLQAQDYRYTESLFTNITVNTDVVYTQAPRLNGLFNDESNTSIVDYKMDIYQPSDDNLSLRPAIIFIHGGAFISGNRNHDDMEAFCDSLARKGYVTATIDYRLGMYISSEASTTRAVYRGLQDGRSAVRFLRANASSYGIDPSRIYMAGSSAGAFICLQSVYMNDATEKPTQANTYSYNNPILPFNQITAPDLGSYDIGTNLDQNGNPDAIFSLWGALKHTDLILAKDDTPVYLIHGTSDDIVPFNIGSPFGYPAFSATYGSNPISARLSGLGSDNFQTWFVEGEGHEFYGVSNGNWAPVPNQYWGTTIEKASDFFYQQHKPQAGFTYTPEGLNIAFHDASSDAQSWLWDFGDGHSSQDPNPSHTYPSSGNFTVTLYIENEIKSWDSFSQDISISNTGILHPEADQISIFPNPAGENIFINNLPDGARIIIYGSDGRIYKDIRTEAGQMHFNMEYYPAGWYLVRIISTDISKNQTHRVLKYKQ